MRIPKKKIGKNLNLQNYILPEHLSNNTYMFVNRMFHAV